jgi:transcriptional antiterminator RfaH
MKRWYVVHTQPNAEDRALWHLRNQGFDCFLPLLRRLRSHARRTTVALEPLFPRYLFAFFDIAATRWRAINGSRGVSQVLTDGVVPRPVPCGVVEELMQAVDIDGVADAVGLARRWKGRFVRIKQGTFDGQLGEVAEVQPGSLRVTLLLHLLGQQATLQMPGRAVVGFWIRRTPMGSWGWMSSRAILEECGSSSALR